MFKLKSFKYLLRSILSKGKKTILAITMIKVNVFTFISSFSSPKDVHFSMS